VIGFRAVPPGRLGDRYSRGAGHGRESHLAARRVVAAAWTACAFAICFVMRGRAFADDLQGGRDSVQRLREGRAARQGGQGENIVRGRVAITAKRAPAQIRGYKMKRALIGLVTSVAFVAGASPAIAKPRKHPKKTSIHLPARSFHATAGSNVTVYFNLKHAQNSDSLLIEGRNPQTGHWRTDFKIPFRGHHVKLNGRNRVVFVSVAPGDWTIRYQMTNSRGKTVATSPTFALHDVMPPPPPAPTTPLAPATPPRLGFGAPPLGPPPPPASAASDVVRHDVKRAVQSGPVLNANPTPRVHASLANSIMPIVGCGGPANGTALYSEIQYDLMWVEPNIVPPSSGSQTWAYQVVYYKWINGQGWTYNVTGPVEEGTIGFDASNLTFGDSSEWGGLPEASLNAAGSPGYWYPLVYYSGWTSAGWLNFGYSSVLPRFTQYEPKIQGFLSNYCYLYNSGSG
jgi:hypothetical protein